MIGDAFDMLVEVLVYPVDEERHRRAHRAQPRHEMAVGVGAAALELLRGEIEKADEMVDGAVELIVGDETAEAGTHLEITYRADVLQRGERDRGKPDLRPRQW